MTTKILMNVDDGLSRQEMDDVRQLLADALSEFAARRTSPHAYVNQRYPVINEIMGQTREDKVKQVTRRVALASKLHASAFTVEFEHQTPHAPMPVMDYYKSCDEDDLAAMSAALAFLPVAQFGERKGWNVVRESGVLVITGPDEQRAFWHEVGGRWMWLEEGVAVEGSVQ